MGRRTILFVDEIHRFNKAQQDAFLPYVERGDIILIGATTENPSFEVISALLSRSRVYALRGFTVPETITMLKRALPVIHLTASDDLLEQIAIYANGDGRQAYNTLEAAAAASPAGELTAEALQDAMQRKMLLYDKGGEEHYNLISALHKSVRSSDADAALYWLTRMLEAGEDRMYIARGWCGWPSRISRWPIRGRWSNARRPCRRCTCWGSPKATWRWRRRRSTSAWRRSRRGLSSDVGGS
jgi:putative ATPase